MPDILRRYLLVGFFCRFKNVSLDRGNGTFSSKAFFFNYLVYGSADPIFQDLEKNKNIFLLFCKKNYFF